MPAGYLHADYAASLSEFGVPLRLERSGGWLLRRPIPGSTFFDAMGCYPLFACADWDALGIDLTSLAGQVVSATLVTDPFATVTETMLCRAFDRVRPFKQHYVVDLTGFTDASLTTHHRTMCHKALRTVEVEELTRPLDALDTWCSLYNHLIERHGLAGLPAFSRRAFSRQLAVPGMVAFRARSGRDTVGMQLWYLQGDVAYSHLTAMSAEGYRRMASYALHRVAIDAFAERARWLGLGGAAGFSDQPTGLTWFKQGWATGTRPTWLCERVLDPPTYDLLAASVGQHSAEYLPRYRSPGLGQSSPHPRRS